MGKKSKKTNNWFTLKAIGFGTAISYYIFLATLYIQLNPHAQTIDIVKELGWYLVYFCIALIGENYIGFKPLMGELYDIGVTSQLQPEEKKVLMKSALERQVMEWNRLWFKLSEEKPKKAYLTPLYKGKITLPQLLWLTLVFFYMTLIKTNILDFENPLNIILQVLCFLILIVLSGKKGVSMLVKYMWNSLETEDKTTLEQNLKSIEILIRSTAHRFYFYDLQSEGQK